MSLTDVPPGVSQTDWVDTPNPIREYTNSLIHEISSLRENQIPYAIGGTHKFSCTNSAGFKFEREMTFSQTSRLETAMRELRKELSMVSWGTKEPWTKENYFNYDENSEFSHFKNDISRLAKIGYRLYSSVRGELFGKPSDKGSIKKRIEQLVKPGIIQLEYRVDAKPSVPISLIYDYPLDSDYPLEEYELCPSFLSAIKQTQSLEFSACFQGNCPSRGKNLTTVCPSGFWGFRHRIGTPLAASSSKFSGRQRKLMKNPQLFVGLSTDEAFVKRENHVANLKSLDSIKVTFATSRNEVKTLLKGSNPDVVYFYCHGGFQDGTPFIQVGSRTEQGISPDFFEAHDIRWIIPPLLIFLNGCRTAALDPSNILDFVTQFVEYSNAVGVVGTQVTISEALAVSFSEQFFKRFLIDGEPLGIAARGTKLHLLKNLNPLGLVYSFYAAPNVRMGY